MRSLRFGLVCDAPDARPADVARRAQAAGYHTVLFPDHLGLLAPFPAMVTAAEAVESVRVGTQVLNIAFRPLGLVAQEAATVDVLSGGRLELGIGAGHAEQELHQIGLGFDPPGTRVRAVGDAVGLLRRAFQGETVSASTAAGDWREFSLLPPPPQGGRLPIMVGGNGDRLLRIGAEQADIVQFTGFSPIPGGGLSFAHFSWTGLANRVELVRAAAGAKFDQLELGLLAQWAVVTENPREYLAGLDLVRAGQADVETLVDNPFVLVGPENQLIERLAELRERLGVSYFAVFDHRSADFDAVVSRLAAG